MQLDYSPGILPPSSETCSGCVDRYPAPRCQGRRSSVSLSGWELGAKTCYGAVSVW